MDYKIPAAFTAFLQRSSWAEAHIQPLEPDASTRRYYRLRRPEGRQVKTAILMHAPKNAEAGLCTPDMNRQARKAAGYNAMARLAANDCTAFVALASELQIRGFSTPGILASDLANGLVLLEDFGSNLLFEMVQKNPKSELKLYRQAVSVLAALSRCSFDRHARYQDVHWPLLGYDETALLAETSLMPQWYLPSKTPALPDGFANRLQRSWQLVLQPVLQAPPVLVLRDFHAQNLLVLGQRTAIANPGLLDFQDAVMGHPAYDLVSLLQDARRDVSPEMHAPMQQLFMDEAKVVDPDGFMAAYAILGAQRAAKILGIFVRLAKKDGKARYLSMLPRVERHFWQNLQHPALQPVADVMQEIAND